VRQDWSSEIYRRAYQLGQITSRCRRIPISANANGIKMLGIDETSRAAGYRWGGVRGYWLAEAGLLTASKPKFREVVLDLKKLGVLCYTTAELMADAAALGTVMMEAAAEEIRYMTEDSIVNGTGAGKPLGFMNSPCLVSVTKETGQAADSVVAENVSKMWSRLWSGSRGNAVWLINQDVEPQLDLMGISVGVGGQLVSMPPGGRADQALGRLKSRPVLPVEYCQTVGDKGDIALCDFSQYLLADKDGVQTASSIHVNFLYDEEVFRFIYRVDGQPLWNSALTPANSTSTLSTFVTLDARA
jgi:HK97 family phage major capsid protein